MAAEPDRRRRKESEKETQQRIRIEALENDLRRRQTSYIRRERAYQRQVEDLQKQLAVARRGGIEGAAGDKMEEIRKTHTQIMEDINGIHARTATKLKEREKDLLRSFRVRLYDVQEELEREKSKANDETTVTWIKKYRNLEKEVDWVKALADKLEQSNKSYRKENERLQLSFSSQQEDRAELIKQLVLVKKDNARLKEEIDSLKNSMELTPEEKASKFSRNEKRQRGNGNEINDDRYKEVIRRLKKLLDSERKNIKALRTTYANELDSRTQLEEILRQCIDDTKQEIARRQAFQSGGSVVDQQIKVSDFDIADRERVMELLLSQERVISLLYTKTFPNRVKPTQVTLPPVSNQERAGP